MASAPDEFCCPVCHDVFKNPVVLLCSHSFCEECVQIWWREKRTQECPLCKTQSEPTCNMALKTLSEAFVQSRDQKASEGLCSLLQEKLKLFCLDHQQPACLLCRDSEKRDEVTVKQLKQLQKYMDPVKQRLKVCDQLMAKFDRTAKHIEVQARLTEKQLKEQFQKLHRFLEEEEEARMAALREEEEQKSQMMKDKMEALSREIAALSDTVRTSEEQLRAEDVSYLQYKAAVDQAQRCSRVTDDPQLTSRVLIDQAKHLGNLTFHIWNKMKNMVSYTPVVLDPNTAHPKLVLSEDLTSVREEEEQAVLEHPGRFDFYASILGSEGFTSGTHSWDVEVGGSTRWTVGVFQESTARNQDIWPGLWRILFYDGSYESYSPTTISKKLHVNRKIQRIRVVLDWTGRKLTFSDPDDGFVLQTFRHKFTERLFPYIWNEHKLPLKVLPAKVCVSVEPRS